MICVKCGEDLRDCECPDLSERLRKASDSSKVAMRWCAQCDNHYARCQCDDPVWRLRVGGELKPLPASLKERLT